MKSYEKFISKEDILKIHENTLKILKNVGVIFENERALEVFRRHGLKIDGNKVFIDEKTLDQCTQSAPAAFTISSPSKGDVTLGGGSQIRAPQGMNIYIEDQGKIRKMNNEDVINQFKLGNSSTAVHTTNSGNLADYTGCNAEQIQFGMLALSLRYAKKLNIVGCTNEDYIPKEAIYDSTRKGIQLVKRFEGVEDKYVQMRGMNSLSPLAYDYAPIERIFALLDENQPVQISPCAMPLLTAPASLAGLMSTTNAEILAGLVLVQLVNPGNPFMYGNVSGGTNMKTIQLSMGSPEASLVNYVTAGLADLYQVPFRTGGAFNDAKDFDPQMGLESMMMLYSTIDCGADFTMHSIGTMGTYNVTSMEKYILDEEIIHMLHRLFRGVDCNEEKLCYSEIEKVGPRGAFLRGRTPKMYREEVYLPSILNKDDPNNWQHLGSVPLRQTAREAAQKRIDEFEAYEATPEQKKILESYLPPQFAESI